MGRCLAPARVERRQAMKSYLDLVPISAKVHKKQNRMSVFCIILSVFLITVIFGMADMFIRSQIMAARQDDGDWHIVLQNISDEEAIMVSARPEVKHTAWYGVVNYSYDAEYNLSGKNLIICGCDESFATEIMPDMISAGAFPVKDNEVLLTENAGNALGLRPGDEITANGPDGMTFQFIVSGFMKNTSKIMSDDSYGICTTTNAFRRLYEKVTDGNPGDYNSVFYVQFAEYGHIQAAIDDIRTQLSLDDDQVYENTKLLGLMGQSGNDFMVRIYGMAVVLFVLVLTAGVMMITSSLNSNIAQRTEFFGMIRCIGATPKQVMRLVRKEALSWCKLAIPVGIAAGLLVIWTLCGVLRWLSPMYFGAMPVFGISFPSVAAGICVGMLTVLLAARSPGKRASKVSPLAAVSGNANDLQPVKKAASTRFFKVDTALGIHHAKSSRKNFVLMAGSFSLSIILFLSFSVTVDFMNHALNSLYPWTPDLSMISPDNTCSIDNSLLQEINAHSGVKRAYGRMVAYHVPVAVNGEEKQVDLVSYEENQFKWAEKYVLEGNPDAARTERGAGLIVYKPQNTIQVNDVVTLNMGGAETEMEIVGMLSKCPFSNDEDVGLIICSEDTFRQLTGENGYTVIDVQLERNVSEADVDEIKNLAGDGLSFSDKRLSNSSTSGTYYSFALFIYGFLTIIALIAVFNIVNSVAMSVAARMRQYGVFRAIGLSSRQLNRMIFAEAVTYVVTGCILGSIIGLTLNKFLFERLISFRWGDTWQIPVVSLGLILAIVAAAVVLAVQGPAKRIKNMSIVDTISTQ